MIYNVSTSADSGRIFLGPDLISLLATDALEEADVCFVS